MQHHGIRTASSTILLVASQHRAPLSIHMLAALAYHAQRSMRGLPALAHVRPNSTAHNAIRTAERTVHRCIARGYLARTHNGVTCTPAGLFALASHPLGRISTPHAELLLCRYGYDAVLTPILQLATHGHRDAITLASYLSLRDLHFPRSLGGDVVPDPRQLALPHTLPTRTGAERANTGAPPQPPHTGSRAHAK